MREIHVSKNDLRTARAVDVPQQPLADGAARLRLDLFALTANNITYAAMGTGMLGYWDFFPGPEGWGKPPVWGFATVVESKSPGVEQGARYYGYFPIAETLDVTPAKAGPRGLADAAPHRAAKAAVYNQYLNVAADPAYDAAFEPEQTLFRPLYGTGWWLADRVQQDSPRAVVFSSASSKTALATAHQLRKASGAELIALTSARNAEYVREIGLYHRVVTYDEAASLNADAPATYLDFIGRGDVRATVHRALGDTLKRSIQIGLTDWAAASGAAQEPAPGGAAQEFFFVPAYAPERLKAEPALGEAMMRDLRAFYPASRAFVTARRLSGADAILESWSRLAAGETPPREGLVLSL